MVEPFFQRCSQCPRCSTATQSHRCGCDAESKRERLERKTFYVSQPPYRARIGRETIERILKWLQFEVCSVWCELFLELCRSCRHFMFIAPTRLATMPEQNVLRNAKGPSDDRLAGQVGLA
jgi:hypothetical protein